MNGITGTDCVPRQYLFKIDIPLYYIILFSSMAKYHFGATDGRRTRCDATHEGMRLDSVVAKGVVRGGERGPLKQEIQHLFALPRFGSSISFTDTVE